MEALYALFPYLLLLVIHPCFAATLTCPKGIFSFGDSLADTGNYAAAFPDPPPQQSSKLYSSSIVWNFYNYMDVQEAYDGARMDMEFASNKASSTRLPFRASNGRLVIDFVAQAFSVPFLSPYFQNIQPNYTSGINFAFSSATARNTPISVPFYLYRQVNHYNYFKGNVYNAHGAANIPPFSLFSTGIHWISIGINDFWQNYNNGLTISEVKKKVVPEAVQSITQAVQRLYGFGARTFMVINVPAVGCLPIFISKFGTNNPSDYDSLGCLKNHNDVAKAYSSLLQASLSTLRQQLSDAYIILGDYYRVHLDAVKNPQKYGITKTGTLAACCGGGGKPNIPVAPCTGSTPVCTDPNSYISWDGLHFTEGFNRIIAITFLRGDYVEPWPNSNLSSVCKLDFSKFYS